ncbi:uncharacterized protein ATNIH1004_002924 [Aspergillus tanneri]|uniref:Major facilitator superfamily (MFS) profile domain-containing protein n=1 Tax=Aspergillus tanneri TaxID=1220188 RepID=A0A5M9MSX6_9EURO|nr:uncharacterized protein ATNIH1004_002924 [Aspergillus tanneri]KAA8650242.1 hypothetical protein ATNIH1004_002924 [Aspergillus tanneri]
MTAVFHRMITRCDPLGILLSVAGILVLPYAVTSANTSGWSSTGIVAPLAISEVLPGLFVHGYRTFNGIVAHHLFSSTSFNFILVLASYGNSPIHTSVLFIALGISALIFNTLSGRLVPFLERVLWNFSLTKKIGQFILCWCFSIPGVLLLSFIEHDTSYWRYAFAGMILYIAGIGAVYITANFVVISSASKADQGAVADVFNVALQVGGSILGLAVITAINPAAIR